MVSIDSTDIGMERQPDGIALTGDIDAHSASTVRDALVPVLAAGDVRADLSGVTFIDSSGLRVLLEAHHELLRNSRRLVLVTPSPAVVRVLQVAGLVSILHVEPPIDRAP